MKATIAILFLPAALAWPSYNGNGHGHGNKRGYGAYKFSRHHHPSGAHLPSDTATGPLEVGNATASQVETSVSGAGSITSTQNIYVTASDQAPIESATTAGGAGGAGGACAETATVTVGNTITVTITGGAGDQAATTAVPETQAPVVPSSTAPEMALPPVKQSSVPAPVSPISQAATPIELVATPSPSSSTNASAAQTTAATPATAPTTPQATSGASSGSKRGVLIPPGSDQADLVTAFNSAEKVSWVANWYSSPPPNLNSRIEYVPQMYDKDSNQDNTWTENAQKAVSEGDKYFLSFGEPETQNDQGFYMDPQTAASTWMEYLQPYTDSVSCGAPGVLQNTQDFTWLSQFMDACEKLGCKIGFVAIHWFYEAEPGNEQGFKDVINNATAIANGKPVWVDNFRADGTNEAQQAFLGDIVPWLEANDAVARYAYASPDRSTGTGFLNSDGSISSLGTFYANL